MFKELPVEGGLRVTLSDDHVWELSPPAAPVRTARVPPGPLGAAGHRRNPPKPQPDQDQGAKHSGRSGAPPPLETKQTLSGDRGPHPHRPLVPGPSPQVPSAGIPSTSPAPTHRLPHLPPQRQESRWHVVSRSGSPRDRGFGMKGRDALSEGPGATLGSQPAGCALSRRWDPGAGGRRSQRPGARSWTRQRRPVSKGLPRSRWGCVRAGRLSPLPTETGLRAPRHPQSSPAFHCTPG